MEKGKIVESDPYLLVLSMYSAIMGAATEGNLLEAIGVQQTPRDVVLRRKELLRFLKSAFSPSSEISSIVLLPIQVVELLTLGMKRQTPSRVWGTSKLV